MVLIFFRLVFQSLASSLPLFLSSFSHPVCILFRSHCLSISPRSTCSCFTSPILFPFLFLALRLASAGLYALCLCSNLHSPLRCLSLSFCILNCPYPASFPFLALQSIPPGLLLYLIFHFLPVSQSCPASPLLLIRAILLCSRCSARRKYSLFAPPP